MDVVTEWSTFHSPVGVLTIEVGVIHGDLWVRTVRGVLGTVATVGYVGSTDVHTVAGSPILSRPTHEDVLGEITRNDGASWHDLTRLDGAAAAPF